MGVKQNEGVAFLLKGRELLAGLVELGNQFGEGDVVVRGDLHGD